MLKVQSQTYSCHSYSPFDVVRAAANKSLKQFGEVISNPEIQSLVPVLLKALVDPAKTPAALSSLLKTSFMHYIDNSSLALVSGLMDMLQFVVNATVIARSFQL